MDGARGYFLGSRLWWSGALFFGPVVGSVTAGLVGAFALTALFALPSFVLFDTDRPWWSDEVRRLPEDAERTRVELRSLTLWSAAALVAGVVVAVGLALR